MWGIPQRLQTAGENNHRKKIGKIKRGKPKKKTKEKPDQNQNRSPKRNNCRKITLETNKTRLLRYNRRPIGGANGVGGLWARTRQ